MMPEERKNLCVFLLEKVPPGLPRRFSSSFFRRGDLWKYQYFFSLLAKTTFFSGEKTQGILPLPF